MTCRQVHRHLLAWLEGELDEATWLAIAQHVDGCERCRTEVHQWRQVMALLRAVAHSDGVPPIPPRLWQQLAPRRRRLSAFASAFVAACLAFVLGWHARSLASSITPPNPAKATERSALAKQPATPQRHWALADIPLSAPTHRVRQEGDAVTLSPKRPCVIPTQVERRQPLTLNGATAVAWGDSARNDWRAWRTAVRSELLQSDERPDDAAPPASSVDEEQVAEGAGATADAAVWLVVPVSAPSAPETAAPYRIFVRVTDPQTQTVRTVQVDATDPHHIVAEWRQQGAGDVPNATTAR